MKEVFTQSPNEIEHLSFLTPIPGQLQPYFFDLACFPGKHFVKWMAIEVYERTDEHMQELKSNGWKVLETHTVEGSMLLLRLSSQLSFVLALISPNQQEDAIILYAHQQDIQHAIDTPVLLISEVKPTEEYDLSQEGIGSQALLFDASNALYHYSVDDLETRGKQCWAQLHDYTQTGTITFLQEESHSVQSDGCIQRHYVSQTAASLASFYWAHHQNHPGTPIVKPHTATTISSLFQPTPNKYRPRDISAGAHGIDAVLLAISNAREGATGWKMESETLVYRHQRPQSTAVVSVRPTVIVEEQSISRQLWERVTRYSDLDGDIFLAMLAHTTAVGTDERGGTWITAEDVLRYRGIAPKSHLTKTQEKRDAGHRLNRIQEVAAGIVRLRDTFVTVRILQPPRKTGGRTRKYTQESYLLLISDFLVPEERQKNDLEHAIAWYYQPGTCLAIPLDNTHVQKKAAWLLQKSLQYDPYREKWEKRFARYFLFNLRVGSATFGGSTMCRSLGAMLDEMSLPVNEDDAMKTVKHFEQTMQKLVRDEYISTWNEEAYHLMMQHRPAHHWLTAWLSFELVVSAVSLGEEITEEAIDQIAQREVQKKRRISRSSQ